MKQNVCDDISLSKAMNIYEVATIVPILGDKQMFIEKTPLENSTAMKPSCIINKTFNEDFMRRL